MTEKAVTPQQPVISIRISDALRSRLDKLREIMALKTGQTVSTSEAAKQLLESARDDRLELVNLLTEPTDSLLRIRGKADARLSLSQAEWTMVAHYCARGAESFTKTAQGQISYESLAEILEAFLAAYALARRPKKSPLDFVYLLTLPGDKQVEAKEPKDVGSDDVRRVVNHTIQMLRNPAQKRRKPILAVRNLYRLLDEETFSNIEKVNDALWPHWPALWRVCARGHYSLHRKPLREKLPAETNDEDFELAVQPALPSLEEGGYRLDLVREEGNEFSPRWQFPGPLAPRYPVCGYPRIAEFRRMLEELDLERDLCQWQGYYFYAHTAILENEERGVFFFARENGITFGFPMEDWQSIRNLFRRAWQAPEVIHTWEAQVLEYGEL
ncbi:MAG: hypothetical protein ABSA80_12750 [Terriglobales bacterium]|jgi:hypothetical protein